MRIPSDVRSINGKICLEPIKPKQVMDPWTETVRARIFGTYINSERGGVNYSSSDSGHEVSSVCLAALVHEFLEEEADAGTCGRARCNCRSGNSSGNGCPGGYNSDEGENKAEPILEDEFLEILQRVVTCKSSAELLLLSEISNAVDLLNEELDTICKIESVNCSHGYFLRSVMKHLRQLGYNAAICKSRWDHSAGLPAGEYEYIDAILGGKDNEADRFIVDISFKVHFEIARASDRYNTLLEALPSTFVGSPEKLQQVLQIMADAAKCSLQKKGMHIPPWRKLSYLQAKWFSAYKRATNDSPVVHKNSGQTHMAEFSSIAPKVSPPSARSKFEMEAGQCINNWKLQRAKDRGDQQHELSERGAMELMNAEWKPRGYVQRQSAVVSRLTTALLQLGTPKLVI